MPLLGVNIDHVATVRQARYRDAARDARATGEPDPLRAAHEAELGGADIITIHLREDRRHITDRDADLLARFTQAKLNLEMGATPEMVAIALRLGVPMCTLVPEGRQEVTTEGGLNVAAQLPRLTDIVHRLHEAKIAVSAFIDADPAQVAASKDAGFDACEIHTGPYAAAFAARGGDPTDAHLAAQLHTVADAGHRARALSMRFHAGHALNYLNVRPVAMLPGLAELHIGHAIVSRAIFTGLRQAVRDMKDLCA